MTSRSQEEIADVDEGLWSVSALRGGGTREPLSDNSSDHFGSIHCSRARFRRLPRLTEGLGSKPSETSRQ